jgi:hypothetical protein
MECMAIGVSGGSNPFNLNDWFKNAGIAPKNQTTEQASSTEETPTDTASKSAANSSERIAQLQNTLGADGFGKVDPNKLRIPGLDVASPLGSIQFNENAGITATSALGEPSSVGAIDNLFSKENAGGGNPEVYSGNQGLFFAARLSRAAGLDDGGGFKGFTATANAELEGYNRLLVG